MRRFLHDVTELAGQRQLALPRHQRGFADQQLATNFSPGKARRNADFVALFGEARPESWHTEILGDLFGRHVFLERLAFDDNLARDLAADRRNLTLEVADACLARVTLDDRLDRLVLENDVLRRQTSAFDGLQDKESLGDLELLLLGVTRQLQHLHAVPEGLRNRVQHVGGTDEHHVRQVVLDVEVVVEEGAVLFGVEHFQQRR